MSFFLSGGVEVLGFISPTEPTDEYPVIDPLYGIDGLRNVNTLLDLNNIPSLRRRAGMLVGVSGGTQYYKLKSSPWNGTQLDWELFSLGSTFEGGIVTGNTIFTQGVTATTFSASTYLGLPLDVYVTGGTYSNGVATFTNNKGETFNVTGFLTGTTTDYFVTGGTFNKNTETLTLKRNDGGIVTVTGFTDIFVTGGTYSNGSLSLRNNNGQTFLVNGFYTGGTDITITGGTYNDGTLTLVNNTGGTIDVTGFYTGETSYVNSITTGSGLSGNSTTGNVTIVNTSPDLTVTLSGGTGILTGGTYPNFTITNTLPDLNVTLTGGTNIEVTGSYPNFGVNYTGQTEFPYLPLSGGTVTGNTNVDGTFVASTISATTYQNLPVSVDTFVTGFSYSNNTFTLSRNQSQPNLTATINTVTGLTINGNLVVTGTTLVNTLTGTTAVLSGSGQNVLTIIGSGSTQPIVSVQGSFGELFTIYDNLIGSLFSVNDISGLPVLEVFSDNTILMGSFVAPSLNTSTRVIAGVGTTNIYSIPTSAYTGAFFDYTVSDGTNLRAGNIMSIWSGSSVNFTETSTTDFGSTTGLTFNMAVSSGNAVLQTSGVTGSWTVKTIVRSI
jgi:hypothetical protein